jgi:hypothetical protein
MAEDRAHHPNRVIDLNAYRATKDRFGTGMRLEHKPENPELTAHEDTAMEVGNPTPAKRSLKSDIKKGVNSVAKFLALDSESHK